MTECFLKEVNLCWGGIIQVNILGKVFAGYRNSTGKGTEVEIFRLVQGTTWGLVLQRQER